MNVLGVIAEYNPFHNGHAYQLRSCKELADADYTVVVLGSDFNQRGTPSIINKYVRTKMALKGGADLVIEMPQFASCASAAYFAVSGSALLANSGIITHLGFGSESGNLEELEYISELIVNETTQMSSQIQSKVKQGQTYAAARNEVIASISNAPLEHPNDILAVEYLRALKILKASIKPLTIKRTGQSYHDGVKNNNDTFLSATAIRNIIFNQSKNEHSDLECSLNKAIPNTSLMSLCHHLNDTGPLTADDFFTILKYSFLCCKNFADIFDISDDYANRLLNFKDKYYTLDQWISNIKTRNYTWTKVSRSLTHIMLNHTKEDDSLMNALNYAPYIRILGFKKDAAPLLKSLKYNSTIPVITKIADAKHILSDKQLYLFEKAVLSERIYKSVEQTKSQIKIKDVYQESPVICE